MKGTKTIELGEDKVTLRMTTGVHEDWQQYLEDNGLSEEDAQQFKHQRIMFALMELYATEDEWKDPNILEKAKDRAFKFKNMGLDQVNVLNELAEDAQGAVGNLKKAPKKSSK